MNWKRPNQKESNVPFVPHANVIENYSQISYLQENDSHLWNLQELTMTTAGNKSSRPPEPSAPPAFQIKLPRPSTGTRFLTKSDTFRAALDANPSLASFRRDVTMTTVQKNRKT